MSHIHLLSKNFRSDKRPVKLIENALEKMAETSKWKFDGAETEKKARVTDYSMIDVFNMRLQAKIDKYEKTGEVFEYNEGFSAEIQAFIKTNYDISGLEIDFKQLAKQRKEREKLEMLEQQARILNGEINNRSLEEKLGLYRTGEIVENKNKGNTIESLQKLYDRFDPKKLQIAPGVFDFTKAHGYDEDLTRHNLNHVKRPDDAQIVAPTLIKIVPKPVKPDFVKQNKTGLGQVSAVNVKRVQMMK